MIQHSAHSIQRLAQRNLSDEKIGYVMEFGQEFHRAGAIIYYLRRRDIPSMDQSNSGYRRLVGTAVVLSKDEETILTVWRNPRDGLKRILKKPEHTIFREKDESCIIR